MYYVEEVDIVQYGFPFQLHVPCRQGDRMLKNVIRAMEAPLPFSSDYAVTVRGYGRVGEGADCPKGALNRRLVQDAIAVFRYGTLLRRIPIRAKVATYFSERSETCAPRGGQL